MPNVSGNWMIVLSDEGWRFDDTMHVATQPCSQQPWNPFNPTEILGSAWPETCLQQLIIALTKAKGADAAQIRTAAIGDVLPRTAKMSRTSLSLKSMVKVALPTSRSHITAVQCSAPDQTSPLLQRARPCRSETCQVTSLPPPSPTGHHMEPDTFQLLTLSITVNRSP